MKGPIFLLVVAVSLGLSSCNNRGGNSDNKPVMGAAKDREDEMGEFLGHFIAFKSGVRTDGAGYTSDGGFHDFKDSAIIKRSSYSFLNQQKVTLPDSFYASALFDCNGFYLLMIRGFDDTVASHSAEWNSSLITLNKSGVIDMLPHSTAQDPGELYKSCWIQNLDDDSIPEVVLRTAYGEEDGGLSDPEVYKIISGKFKAVNNIKIDTAAYNF